MLRNLNGNKTYVVGVLTVLFGVLGLFLGEFDLVQAGGFASAGLAMLGFRSALKKVE